jgi:membrane-bound metal-dependent hydrolase YbcI (DUF457 family)
MPGYQGHLAGGVATFFIVLPAALSSAPDVITLAEWFLFALGGALVPDVDIKSKGQRYFYCALLLLFLFCLMNGWYEPVAWCSLVAFLPMLTTHRGIFHRVWFVIGAPLLLLYVLYAMDKKIGEKLLWHTLFFIAGALSHIVLDYQKIAWIQVRKK